MKKVLGLLLVCFMVLGVTKAFADVRADSLNADIRQIDDLDQIWFYPNLVNDYKNTFDIRTNYLNHNSEWGGFLDGQHTSLGVIGAYVYRPAGYDGTRGWNFNALPGWYGVGSGWYGTNWEPRRNNPTNTTGRGNLGASTPENKVDLFWGSGLGDKGTVGVQLNYADAQPNGASGLGVNFNSTATDDNPAAANSSVAAVDDSRVLGANVGIGIQDLGPFNSANLHLGYFMGSLNISRTNTPTGATAKVNDTEKDNGISTIELGLGLTSKIDDNSSMRLYADAYLDNNNRTQEYTTDSTNDGLHNNGGDIDETNVYKYSDIITTLGLGCNHKVLDGKATISSGFQATWVNSSFNESQTTQNGNTAVVTNVDVAADKYVDDEWSLNWNASVEAKLANWLTARAGINRPIIWRTGLTTTNNTTYVANAPTTKQVVTSTTDSYVGNSGSTYAMGFGVNFENWELDAAVNVGDFYNAVGTVAPGNGILFTNNNYNNGGILTTYNADVRYRF